MNSMEKLTNKQKIDLLTKARELLINKDSNFICCAIHNSSNTKILTKDVFEYIPELLKYKPNKLYVHSSVSDLWFNTEEEDRIKRIDILKKTIKDLQHAKVNNTK